MSADHASRILTGSNSKHRHPEFLWNGQFQWLKQITVDTDDNDTEINTEIKVNAFTEEVGVLEKLEAFISSWIKLVKVVAWIIKMKKILLTRIRKER